MSTEDVQLYTPLNYPIPSINVSNFVFLYSWARYLARCVYAMIIHFAPDFLNEELLIITKIYES